jgi:hypothetical protein
MSDLTAKFEALEEQLDAADAATQAKLVAINAALDLINTQLDTQTINNAANTRYLLSALGTLNPCTDCEGISITVPPTDTTAVTLDEDLCKRVQAFLHAMQSVYTVLDTMSAFGVGFSTSILTAAFNEVITALANGDTTPLPSFPEAVQIVGDGVSYIADNLFTGHTLVGLFTPLYFDLLRPMYEAGSASAAQAIYNGIIDGTDYSVFEMRLLEHAAYNELYSYYFDPASDPNLAGYDGTLCLVQLADITECVELTGVLMNWGYGDFFVAFAGPINAWYFYAITGDFYSFTFEVTDIPSGNYVDVMQFTGPGAETPEMTITEDGIAHLFFSHSTAIGMHTQYPGNTRGPFTIRVCPPS